MTEDPKPKRDALKARIAIAKHLRTIEELALGLHAQALNTPNAKDFPGGTALHMLGPAASIAAWEAQYEATEEAERWDSAGNDRWANQPKLDPATYQGDDNEHPLNVLCFWTRVVREDREQPTGLSPTISREIDYLRGQLDWICQSDEYGDPEWPMCFEMQDDLRGLVRRMEDVLHEGERRDYGVECLSCDRKLVKMWGIDEGTDWHFCEGCGLRYDGAEYGQALKRSYLANAEWLSSEDMLTAWRIRRGSLSSWASGETPKVRKKRDHNRGLIVYNVADAKRERDRRNADSAKRDTHADAP